MTEARFLFFLFFLIFSFFTQAENPAEEKSNTETNSSPPITDSSKEIFKDNLKSKLLIHPDSWFNKHINNENLYKKILSQGIPAGALRRVFEFLDLAEDKDFLTRINAQKTQIISIKNKNYISILDFTLPSYQRRYFLIHLKTGIVEKYYVSHGVNTGITEATTFSNIINSRQSSLGIYITGNQYNSGRGQSLYLYGVESSNDKAFERQIIMHGAKYVSLEFLEKYGRMGRSWGCPAVSVEIIQKIAPLIEGGSVLYIFHKDLMGMTTTSPTVQKMRGNQKPGAQDVNPIMPEEMEP